MELASAKRIQHLEIVHQQFWRLWRQNYITSLQSRGKWNHEKKSLEVGDIVLLMNEGKKRHEWPLAKVVETIGGRDGLVRSVKLLCDQKELMRPVQLVVPLEVHDENTHTGSSD